MARKAKKKLHKMPPLSFVDKLIYWTIMVLLVASYFLLMFGTLYLRNKMAFADEAVIAVEENASLFWLAVPWFTWFILTFIPWVYWYQERMPIFGRRNFKYGPPAWPRVYPLFMKNKPPVWVSERKKKEKKQRAIFLLVVLLLSFIPYPWSLYGRDCLRDDGSIVQYNMFNRQIREFRSGEIAEIEIRTFKYSTGGQYNWKSCWGVEMVFKTDSGKKYCFDSREFRSDREAEIEYWLSWMLQIKGRYDPELIRYDGVKHLKSVIAYQSLNQEEVQLLYQLFNEPYPSTE